MDDRLADESDATLRARAAAADAGARVPDQARHARRLRRCRRSTSSPAIDPWFLSQMHELVEAEREYARWRETVDDRLMRRMKRLGFSDRQLAQLRGETERAVRAHRWALGVRPTYKMVDTCAGEFPSSTPYLYWSYDEENEAPRSGRAVGGDPGQRAESHRAGGGVRLLLRARGARAAAGRVRDDHDQLESRRPSPRTSTRRTSCTSSRSRFEDVLEIVEREQPIGVIVQLGGQTPLKLTRPLEAAGVRILGTSPDAIDIAEDRRRFDEIARRLGIRQPENGTATSVDEAVAVAGRVGYPVLVRPSYVLGGRAMEIVYDETSLREYFARAVLRVGGASGAHRPLPGGCLRGGRGRDRRRRARGDRRRDAAHRGRRHPLRRLGVRAAAVPDRRAATRR